MLTGFHRKHYCLYRSFPENELRVGTELPTHVNDLKKSDHLSPVLNFLEKDKEK